MDRSSIWRKGDWGGSCLAGLGLLLLAMNLMLQSFETLAYAYCMIAGVFVLKHYLNLREADCAISSGSAGAWKPVAQASKA